MSVIKISELDSIPSIVTSDDFFPLVDSGSMTTYRATVAQLAQALTGSINQHVSGSKFSSQSLFASTSVSASHSLTANNVYLAGTNFYFPYWTGSGGANGNLKTSSPLHVTFSVPLGGDGIVALGETALSTAVNGVSTFFPYYSQSGWFRRANYTVDGMTDGVGGVGGISSNWPIISGFVGSDIITYQLSTGSLGVITNQFWSGSANSGSYKTISAGLGQISQSLNGKWCRVACQSIFGENVISMNAAKGEAVGAHNLGNGWFGRIKLFAHTDETTNIAQMVDITLHNEQWEGGLSVEVDSATVYTNDVMKKFRLSIWTPAGSDTALYGPQTSGSRDPMMALDVFVDNIPLSCYTFNLGCASWGSMRFLDEINVDPPVLRNTGSLSNAPITPQKSTYLIFPPEPGFYSSNAITDRNYNIHGLPVTIWPSRNERTGSARDNVQFRNAYSLNVSGTINVTDKYYAGDTAGQSGTFTQYVSSSGLWKQCVYKGGILVDSASSVPAPISGSDSVGVGTIMAFGGTSIPNNWLECDGAALLTASYSSLYTALKHVSGSNSSYGYVCDIYGNYNVSGYYFKMPDFRGEFLRGWDHGRGIDSGRNTSSYQRCGVQTHKHIGSFGANSTAATFGYGDTNSHIGSIGGVDSNNYYWFTNNGTTVGTAIPNAEGIIVSETRPRNLSVIYIIKYSNAIDFATAGTTLAGDVTGNVSTTTVVGLRGTPIDTAGPTDGQYLKYDSSLGKWTPSTISGVVGVGRSYIYANPSTAMGSVDGNSIYVINSNRHTSKWNIVNVNMQTNVATFVGTSSANSGQWYGRLFNVGNVPQVTGSANVYHGYFFTDDGLYDFSVLSSSMNLIPSTPTTVYYDLPVSVSFAASSGSRPTIWALQGSYNATTDGKYPTVRWRQHYWNGSTWTYSYSAPVDLMAIDSTNRAAFLNFYNNSANAVHLMLWDYNYINKRYYLVDTSNGLLHILHQDVGTMITSFSSGNISYVKTLALPSINSDNWADISAEKMVVDYDPITGDERGIIYTRKNNTGYLGVVNYVNWPE